MLIYIPAERTHLLKTSSSKEQTKRVICRKTKPFLLQLIVIISQEYHCLNPFQLLLLFFFHFSTSGLFAAAHDMKMEWLVVKGICGFVHGVASTSHSWKTYACVMAASVVSNMLSNSFVFGDWPHYGGTCTLL